jgi:hypothetical protein
MDSPTSISQESPKIGTFKYQFDKKIGDKTHFEFALPLPIKVPETGSYTINPNTLLFERIEKPIISFTPNEFIIIQRVTFTDTKLYLMIMIVL